jgi:putative oxidoreductase
MLNGIIPVSWSSPIHAALRIVTGLLFLEHGLSKFFNWPVAFPTELNPLLTFAGILELAGGILIILGLFTRVTAFVLSGFMAVAYFMAHMPQNFFPIVNQGEAAILFCFIFLWLAAAGAGPFSLDATRNQA